MTPAVSNLGVMTKKVLPKENSLLLLGPRTPIRGPLKLKTSKLETPVQTLLVLAQSKLNLVLLSFTHLPKTIIKSLSSSWSLIKIRDSNVALTKITRRIGIKTLLQLSGFSPAVLKRNAAR
jgi:hypothetical protein